MKKNMSVLVMSLVLTACFTAQADLTDRTWTSKYVDIAAGKGGEVNDDGIGWWTAIFNVTDGAETGGNTTASIGWLDGSGYGINVFQFDATEGDAVLLRLYDNANELSAAFRIDSASQVLPDLNDPPTPGTTDITFNFSSSSWQAVPEPATALLFGIGGMGVWLLRRSKLKSKEEADA